MAKRLDTRDNDFPAQFEKLIADRSEAVDVSAVVRDIIAYVRAEGDRALFDLTEKFDRFDVESSGIRLGQDRLEDAWKGLDDHMKSALVTASDRIKSFHRRQIPGGLDYVDETGTRLGQFWRAIDAVGLYVPGGTASYPSSVLMNAIPAVVAGVPRIVMTVPSPDGILSDMVLAAAKLAGVHEVYTVGGAQAVAALAYGTETIDPVHKIVGPGNAYVAEAKRQVFGRVGIDTIAGPSEILVISDGHMSPDWIAADLLSQAEHDILAQALLITDNEEFAGRVEAAVAARLEALPRRDIADQSWKDHGGVIVCRHMDEAVELANHMAPEHLELCVEEPEAVMSQIKRAGAVFLGKYTPEAIGDYVAGPNHVLPTGASARFSSGLGVYDFMTRTTFAQCSADSLARIGPAASSLAASEGLDAHSQSVDIRLEGE